MIINGFFKQLSERELGWLDRRMKDNSKDGIPDAIRNKIVVLGYGEPNGLNSFRLTERGEIYLRKYGSRRDTRA